MNYVFFDTCTWIDFSSGKKNSGYSSFDFSKEKNQVLDSLEELINSKDVVLLKNEITDLEFKSTPIKPLIDAYKNNFESFKKNFEKNIIPFCRDNITLSKLRKAYLSLDDITSSFNDDYKLFNKRVIKLYNSAISINVSEKLKQKALLYSIIKDHKLFNCNKNNVNDFLILYSIQEWIESYPELRELDETNENHQVYFVTKNIKDFAIKGDLFDEELGVSQLIKPILNLNSLVSILKLIKHNAADFLPNYTLEGISEKQSHSKIEIAIDMLNKLIQLKKDFFLSFVNSKISSINTTSKMKYLGNFLTTEYYPKIVGKFPIVRSQNIREYRLNSEMRLVSNNLERTSKSIKGDLFITSYGGRVGEHCINNLDENVYVHYSVYVFRINQDEIIPDFMDYFLRCYDLSKDANCGATRKLNISNLEDIKICLPILEQQKSLVTQFKNKEVEIEKDILAIKRKIKMILK
ncbi:restriction endonuclease subunit S [uncultured Bacteroides sp.]|uniref:restriction endonuclease subunit S n=1 Tax=uncultured Bacteroides sp. TaxID=162156 RepID=UPI002AAADE5E|nr:restriction endonuclease subunit S [uncultured Bacteroides sp.]